MSDRPALHVICSDRARNGKTLLARLVADWLRLSGERPFIIDLDEPDAPLAARWPGQSLAADFSTIGGRVRIFDAVMEAPRRDHVMDIPARHLDDFLREAEKIAFFDAAREAGMEVIFLFMVDKSMRSIRKARELMERFENCRFHPARNAFVGDLLKDEDASELYLDLYLKGEVALPKLTPDTMATVEGPGFSFRDFALGQIEAPTSFQHYELSDFTDTVFEQLNKLQFRLDMEELKDMGLI